MSDMSKAAETILRLLADAVRVADSMAFYRKVIDLGSDMSIDPQAAAVVFGTIVGQFATKGDQDKTTSDKLDALRTSFERGIAAGLKAQSPISPTTATKQ